MKYIKQVVYDVCYNPNHLMWNITENGKFAYGGFNTHKEAQCALDEYAAKEGLRKVDE